MEHSDTRNMFEDSIERLCADQLNTDLILQSESGNKSQALWTSLEESGFALALASEEAGGAGVQWSDVCGVIQTLGKYAVPVPLAESILANWLLSVCGLHAHDQLFSFAAESSLQLNNGTICGVAKDIPWGRHVEHVLAITQDEKPMLVLLATETGSEKTLTLNTASEPRDSLHFTNVSPIASAHIPTHLSPDILLYGAAMLRSAQIAGGMSKLLSTSIEYANERKQFGRPISKFQAIQQQMAVLSQHTAAAVIACEAAFAESNGDELAKLQITAAKISSSEAASIGTSIAHAVHGAIGFTHEHSLHLLTRRLWSWRSEYGSLTYWSKQLGRTICENGAKELWPTITRMQLS